MEKGEALGGGDGSGGKAASKVRGSGERERGGEWGCCCWGVWYESLGGGCVCVCVFGVCGGRRPVFLHRDLIGNGVGSGHVGFEGLTRDATERGMGN